MTVREYRNALAEYWNRKLSSQWALAPRDLTWKGLVNDKNYRTENTRLGKLGNTQVLQELSLLRKEHGTDLHYKWVVIFGPGLCRDLNFVARANQLGLHVIAYDISQYSCDIARMKFEQLPHVARVENTTILADVSNVCDLTHGHLVPSVTKLIYAGEFWQILPRDTMTTIMRKLGRKFRKYPENFRMAVVHPFGKDNNRPVEWNGNKFTGVTWGDTTPFELQDLIRPLEEGLGRKVAAVRMHKAKYYHQTYSAFTLVARV